MKSSLMKISLCVLIGALVWTLAPGEPMLKNGLVIFALIGMLWITQAIPIVVTALLVPLLAILSGLLSPKSALSSFSNPIIFLFLGGFALAAALSNQGLDKKLASSVMRMSGGNKLRAILLICAVTAFMSMWISNTATTAMMIPVALGFMRTTLAPETEPSDTGSSYKEKAFILLALAYSASIGGMGTLIGSPPNAIAAAETGISFLQWMLFGIPLMLLLLPVMLLTLFLVFRPNLRGSVDVKHVPMNWTREKIITLCIFLLTVLLWIFSAPLSSLLGIQADIDAVIAIFAILLLIVSKSVSWGQIEMNGNWGVLILFGGGITLSEVMKKSEASLFLANGLVTVTEGIPPALVLLMLIAFVVLLTELVSNTASAALLIPIFTVISPQLGWSSQSMAAVIAICASCAFMLPVATPPNAIVYATGDVSQGTMMRCGAWLNAVCILTIYLVSQLVG